MDDVFVRIGWDGSDVPVDPLLHREWLVTNGLGGYASGSIVGVSTRRYHGLLVAALPAPLGRYLMLSHLTEEVRLPKGERVHIGGVERAGGQLEVRGMRHLVEFRLESGLPVWRFRFGSVSLEKRLVMVHMQNTVHLTYRLISGRGPVRLLLRPTVHFRPHDARVDHPLGGPYSLTVRGKRYEITEGGRTPPLRLQMVGRAAAFVTDALTIENVLYRIELSRGYDAHGDLWSPGHFRVTLHEDSPATLVASTEDWDTIEALHPEEAYRAEVERRTHLVRAAHPVLREGAGVELVLAADQFVITPTSRVEDAARAHATGDEVRTVIAGYHWFTDWGRDTMISLEGLMLATGRHLEAGYILRTFGHYVRDGLIPNMFPEGEKEGRYDAADATLWFFHAVERYVRATGDRQTLEQLMPRFRDIVERHLRGTCFGIGVDPADGLLRQGAQGYALTWMDAKVGDWIVTPRRGKAVEINALWYNALRLIESWERSLGGDAARYAALADRVYVSFNRRFWYPEGGYLFDVVDGEGGADDPSCRPNQLFAISLDHPVLETSRWARVLDVVRTHLLTPVGLRSLAPGHPDYKPRYDGDLRARDAAYHQGTVWPWLIGPFVDAWLLVHPKGHARARGFLDGLIEQLNEACLGSISEIFDAEPPFHPRGCIAQAWSVAELLRCLVKTAPPQRADSGDLEAS